MSHITCQVSGVSFHVSCVRCQMSFSFFSSFSSLGNLVELFGGGSVINGPALSSLQATMVLNVINEINILKKNRQTNKHVTITVLRL